MAYTFKQIEAHDPNNPGLVAPNAMVTIFAPGDPAMTPLTLTTLDGQPLTNPVKVNGLGYGPPFMHATLDQVAWAGGGLTGTFESYQGMKEEAVAARAAAEAAGATAAVAAAEGVAPVVAEAEAAADAAAAAQAAAADSASAAATSAALVGAPADTAIAAAINGAGTATKAALTATIATAVNGVTPVSDNQNLAAYGDSLTEPGQWIAELVARQGVAVTNLGKSGQSSAEVAMRQGGLVPKVTVTGGTIPASGSVAVAVDYPTGAFKSNVAGAMANPQYVGMIAGVPGTLVANIQGSPRTWSFTRTTPGTAVAASGQRYFLSTEGPLQAKKEQILWTGRNFSGDRVITDTADMVAFLRHHVIDPSFTVVSIITSQTEILGSAEYNAVMTRNATLKATYGDHYCEVRRPLIDSALAWAGITPTAGDLTDIANDTVPRSLQVGDGFHLNATGQQFVGKLIAEHRTRLGYDRTGPIVAANIGPAPTYTPTVHELTVTGASHRYVASTLDSAAVGTRISSVNSVGEPGEPKFLRPVVTGSGATLRDAAGLKYLEFNGTSDRMYVPTYTVAQPYSVAIVYRLRSTGADKAVLSMLNGTPANPVMRRGATGNVLLDAGTALQFTPTTALDTGWHVMYASVNGATSIVGVDGQSATGNAGTLSLTGLRVGQGAADYSDIDVAEIVQWDRALTSGELAQVRADMKAEYTVLP